MNQQFNIKIILQAIDNMTPQIRAAANQAARAVSVLEKYVSNKLKNMFNQTVSTKGVSAAVDEIIRQVERLNTTLGKHRNFSGVGGRSGQLAKTQFDKELKELNQFSRDYQRVINKTVKDLDNVISTTKNKTIKGKALSDKTLLLGLKDETKQYVAILRQALKTDTNARQAVADEVAKMRTQLGAYRGSHDNMRIDAARQAQMGVLTTLTSYGGTTPGKNARYKKWFDDAQQLRNDKTEADNAIYRANQTMRDAEIRDAKANTDKYMQSAQFAESLKSKVKQRMLNQIRGLQRGTSNILDNAYAQRNILPTGTLSSSNQMTNMGMTDGMYNIAASGVPPYIPPIKILPQTINLTDKAIANYWRRVRAWWKVGMRSFQRDLLSGEISNKINAFGDKMSKSLQSAISSFRGNFYIMTGFVTAYVGVFGKFIKESLSVAGHAAESNWLFKRTFEDLDKSSDKYIRKAESFVQRYSKATKSMFKPDLRRQMAQNALFFKNAFQNNPEKTYGYAERATKHAVDFGSFWDTTDAVAQRTMNSAALGFNRTPSKYGINVSAPFAIEEGKKAGFIDKQVRAYKQLNPELQTQAKLVTSTSTLTKQLAIAENDRIKTSGQLIGMQRTFGELEKSVLEVVGTALLPTVLTGYETLRITMEGILLLWETNKEEVEKNIKAFVGFASKVIIVAGGLLLVGQITIGVVGAIQMLALAFNLALTPILGLIKLAGFLTSSGFIKFLIGAKKAVVALWIATDGLNLATIRKIVTDKLDIASMKLKIFWNKVVLVQMQTMISKLFWIDLWQKIVAAGAKVLEFAWRIAWLGIVALIIYAIALIVKNWDTLKMYFVHSFTYLKVGFETLVYNFQVAWGRGLRGMANGWNTFVTGLSASTRAANPGLSDLMMKAVIGTDTTDSKTEYRNLDEGMKASLSATEYKQYKNDQEKMKNMFATDGKIDWKKVRAAFNPFGKADKLSGVTRYNADGSVDVRGEQGGGGLSKSQQLQVDASMTNASALTKLVAELDQGKTEIIGFIKFAKEFKNNFDDIGKKLKEDPDYFYNSAKSFIDMIDPTKDDLTKGVNYAKEGKPDKSTATKALKAAKSAEKYILDMAKELIGTDIELQLEDAVKRIDLMFDDTIETSGKLAQVFNSAFNRLFENAQLLYSEETGYGKYNKYQTSAYKSTKGLMESIFASEQDKSDRELAYMKMTPFQKGIEDFKKVNLDAAAKAIGADLERIMSNSKTGDEVWSKAKETQDKLKALLGEITPGEDTINKTNTAGFKLVASKIDEMNKWLAKKVDPNGYEWGGKNPNGQMDCSGLSENACKILGIKSGRGSANQAVQLGAKALKTISDAGGVGLLFIKDDGVVDHVGVKSGDLITEASGEKTGIISYNTSDKRAKKWNMYAQLGESVSMNVGKTPEEQKKFMENVILTYFNVLQNMGVASGVTETNVKNLLEVQIKVNEFTQNFIEAAKRAAEANNALAMYDVKPDKMLEELDLYLNNITEDMDIFTDKFGSVLSNAIDKLAAFESFRFIGKSSSRIKAENVYETMMNTAKEYIENESGDTGLLKDTRHELRPFIEKGMAIKSNVVDKLTMLFTGESNIFGSNDKARKSIQKFMTDNNYSGSDEDKSKLETYMKSLNVNVGDFTKFQNDYVVIMKDGTIAIIENTKATEKQNEFLRKYDSIVATQTQGGSDLAGMLFSQLTGGGGLTTGIGKYAGGQWSSMIGNLFQAPKGGTMAQSTGGNFLSGILGSGMFGKLFGAGGGALAGPMGFLATGGAMFIESQMPKIAKWFDRRILGKSPKKPAVETQAKPVDVRIVNLKDMMNVMTAWSKAYITNAGAGGMTNDISARNGIRQRGVVMG